VNRTLDMLVLQTSSNLMNDSLTSLKDLGYSQVTDPRYLPSETRQRDCLVHPSDVSQWGISG